MDENQDSQPVVIASPNPVSLSLGIVGMVIGVLGIIAFWVPPMASAAVPIGVVGFILSIVGVGFACVKEFRSIEMPILGGVLCIAAIGLSAYSTIHAASLAKQRQAAIAAGRENREEAAREAGVEKAAFNAEQQHNRAERWKSQLADLQTSLPDKQAAVTAAQTNFDAVQASYNSFMAAQPWRTNAAILNLEGRLASAINERNSYAQSVGTMARDAGNANRATYALDHDPNPHPYPNPYAVSKDGATGARQAQMAADQSGIQNANQMVASLNQQIPQLQAQLNNTMLAIKKFQDDKLAKAQGELNAATQDLQSTQQRIKQLTDQLSRV